MKKLLLFLFCIPFLGTAQNSHTINTVGSTFSPSSLTINVGDTVNWNNTAGSHNVNATQAIFPNNPEGFGNSVGAGWSFQWIFTIPGTYDYQCDPHVGIGMTGIIIANALAQPLTYVPDSTFEAYLEANGMGNNIPNDSNVFTSAIDTLTYLKVDSLDIADLIGIEDFSALSYLNCAWNQLSSLDVSNNTALTHLDCMLNNLDTIDVSNNTALTYLECSYQYAFAFPLPSQLTSLDVSNNIALTYLSCSHNEVSSIDVSNNTALTHLDVWQNQLTTLDISNNTALTYLDCDQNNLDTLDVSTNTTLDTLWCSSNNLDTLDVSANTALTNLYCTNNQLTSLDVSNNTALTTLYSSNNNLDTLDISNNTALISLGCSNNNIDTLYLSTHTALTYLSCYSNQLTSLDLSTNTALTSLSCKDNTLDTLDLSNNTALTNLSCQNNQLTSLDVSNNTALTNLVCAWNNLTSLDVSNNTALANLQCNDNQLTSLDLRNGNNNNMYFHCKDNLQLFCIDVDAVAWADTNWTVANGDIDSTMSFSTNCAIALGCTDTLACNYDSNAIIDDNSCVYPVIWQQAFPICNGDSAIVGTSVYDTTGNYIDTLTSVNGCDSIVFTNLTVFQHTTNSIMQNICDGESFVLGNSVYTTTGNYIDTLNTTHGCDSIVYTNLVVDDNTYSYDTLAIIPNINMYWNNILVNVSGDYDVTFIDGNANGCDSTAYLNLTVAITGISDIANNKSSLIKITDMLGQETPYRRNTPLFYIYDDGTVEKRIVIQ